MHGSNEGFSTEIFTGANEDDLNRKVWDWQIKNPVTILTSHADEMLPLNFEARRKFSKIDSFPDRWSRRVDYVQRS